MTSLVALVSGFGWHVEDLRRAAGLLGVSFHAVPFSRVSADVGTGPPTARVRAGDLDLVQSRDEMQRKKARVFHRQFGQQRSK